MVNVDAIATSLRCSRTGCRCNASISKEQPLVHCPAHSDDDPSLSLKEDEGKILVHCFAGCSPSAVMAALRSRGLWPSRETNGDKDRQLITVESLALAKGLPAPFLHGLGLYDLPGEGVGIPYSDGQGQVVVKKRTSLVAKRGSFWPKGQPLLAYGLDRLEDVRQVGALTQVEGESDCWTLWYYGFPALGIPGANATRVLEAQHLENIRVLYVFQEPDQAGTSFIQGICQRLRELGWPGQAYVVKPPSGITDVNDWHRLESPGFKDI
jgi:putative DNA primase/helicase